MLAAGVDRSLCSKPRPLVPPRLVAAALLLVLPARYAWTAAHGGFSLALGAGLLSMLLLGACLWWVAHRQVGTGGALVALSLLVTLPILPTGPVSGAVPGLFAMLYSSVGVAHALQGPRRKWKPRILLMGALCGFTAFLAPTACAMALVLALAGMLYLAEDRRRLLPTLFAFWAVISAAGVLLRQMTLLHGLFADAGALSVPTRAWAGIGFAGAAAIVYWGVSRRSRYFGNTAPLITAVLIALAGLIVGQVRFLWALPVALLFIAGVFADGLESHAKPVWIAVAAGAVLLQIFLFQ